MYTVTTDAESQQQVEALPDEALAWFAALRAALEVAPWNGRPYLATAPDSAMRTWSFGAGGQGFAVYLVLEEQRRVDLLRVVWAG